MRTNSKANFGISDFGEYIQSFNYRMRVRELIKSTSCEFQSRSWTFVFSLADAEPDMSERSELKGFPRKTTKVND
jgi:hypothetical protein